MTVKPTYFTCTLGQAESLGLCQPHSTINALLDHKASTCPDVPAVGFANPTTTPWQPLIFTFTNIKQGAERLAAILADRFLTLRAGRTTVGLLCPSTPEFLFTWLALIRLGHAVLLIAPQCAPSAITALCKQCEAPLLLFDESYDELAKQAAAIEAATLDVQCLPFDGRLSISDLLSGNEERPEYPQFPVTSRDTAYLHHTSGTSTGVPKPIPQSHNAAVGVLPAFEDGIQQATFTTTPLYHGGVADFFRSASSSAMIWLFPGRSIPITASNIVKCLDVAKEASQKQANLSSVKYFSSVPYVLQLLESDDQGLNYLTSMDMVGVGGAALPVEVGNRLVSHNVHLLSRFGSAECGFLLSSHRDFANDTDWQFLRRAPDQKFLHFEPQESGLSELIIRKGWPHMAKHNREDGSFATADLFAPHPTITDAWKYHSRADSQLTLVTGKKFDPAPLEADIATSEMLDDAVIFGNGQPYPGVLLFRSAKAGATSDSELVQALWPSIEKLNQESQDHAKIPKSMLIALPRLDQPLEKSSKGTLLRSLAYDRFDKQIEQAYEQTDMGEDVPDEELNEAIAKIVTGVSHKKTVIEDDTDLFSAGIDSVAGMQIRSRLRALLPKDKRMLPMTLVEDCGSIDGLARYIRGQRSGHEEESKIDDLEYMKQLVEDYSKFRVPAEATTSADDDGDVVVLTGATGALGAHVLNQYRQMKSVKKIYCLVRGSDEHAAKERVEKGLQQRCLPKLDSMVVVLPVRLGNADLGLQAETYERLTREATVIMHVAWSVNFRMRLKSFVKDNIAGVTNLINLALSSTRPTRPSFAFCSSVASVMNSPEADVPEVLYTDPTATSPLGYSQSKWVAEQICHNASEAGLQVAIFRVGQLAGDTHHGVWNSSEAWPLMLSSTSETHSLPDLQDEVLDWLPVDIAATALVQGGASPADSSKGVKIFHVVNYNTRPSWADMVAWLQKHENIALVPPTRWVEQLSRLQDTGSSHPALRLLSHWQNSFATNNGSATSQRSDDSHTRVRKTFATVHSRSQLSVLRQIEPVDEVYFEKLWTWIRKEM